MPDVRITEPLADLIHTAIWAADDRTTETSVRAWAAAQAAITAGWRPLEVIATATWIRTGDAGQVVVEPHQPVVTGQTVAITESSLHPGVVRDPVAAPTRRALHDAAGEELRVQ